MNYKTKCEIVERLKENERAYYFLNDMEKEVLSSFGLRSDHIGSLDWDSSFRFGCNNGGQSMAVYRIHRDYVVPIEVPKGYKLVEEEETANHGKPIGVLLYSFEGDQWRPSEDFDGSMAWCCDYYYAVPEDYSFEPETVQMTVEEICKLVGKNVEIVK